MTAPVLFDRDLRRIRRSRAWRSPGSAFLHEHAFSEIIDRLGDVRRRFSTALLLGGGSDWRQRLSEHVDRVVVADPSPSIAVASGGVATDEDRLCFADASFDLIVNVGTLDAIDDLPGALLLLRRALRPDGLLLAAMSGAATLPRLQRAMLAADEVAGGAAARMHPAIDVRTGGDLLSRAGYALPVADMESLDVSYASLFTLVADLRAHGATNMLKRRSQVPIGRAALAAASNDFARDGIEGRTIERIQILYLSGWSPSPDQAEAAPRGRARR